MRTAEHEVARDDAFAQDATLVVDVAQEHVQRGDALAQAALDGVPVGPRNDPRHEVERKDALGALLVAVDREGDALVQERAIGHLLPSLEFVDRQHAELLEEGVVVGPGRAGRCEHLVVRASERVLVEWRRK